MKLKDYQEQRKSMLDEAQALIEQGKLDEATAKKTEIEELDNKFEAEKKAQAEFEALKGPEKVPEKLQGNAKMEEENTMGTVLNAASKEYRSAFFKHILGKDDQMTKLENEAFVHTTTTTAAPLPTTMLNNIWDLVSKQHVIMGDVTIYKTGTILEVVKHTAIVAGKAKKVAEATANDDENNTFVKVTLSGNDFSKVVKISYAEALMSIDALETYLTNEIATGIGDAMADDVIAQIETDMNAANKVTSTTAGTITFAEVSKIFGLLKRVTTPVLYMTRSTLYNYLVAMVDTAGRPIYVPNANAAEPGVFLGAQIKIEDSVADGKLLLGDAKKVICNMVQDIMVESEKDIKDHTYVYSGYSRAQSTLIDDLAFAELTVKTA